MWLKVRLTLIFGGCLRLSWLSVRLGRTNKNKQTKERYYLDANKLLVWALLALARTGKISI